MCTSISENYAGKSIFLTGGAGFLGKVLLEKLLYSCPGIETIYVLLRPRKELPPEERLAELKKSQVFQRLRKKSPDALNKIKVIKGDIEEPRLGISQNDEELLIEKVSYVFHSAAAMRFYEHMDVALKCNVKGTEYILDLCSRMKNIQALLYVSTAYASICERRSKSDPKSLKSIELVDEVVYPPPVDLDMVDTLIREGANMKITKETSHIFGGKQNTYIFSKSLAENLVAKRSKDIPLVIVRPSIVCASLEEPEPCWLDSWNGSSLMLMHIMNGTIRTILGKSDHILDFIPVDCVTNLMIVAAARAKKSDNVVIYHACSSYKNPSTWKHITDLAIDYSVKNNFNKMPMPWLIATKSTVLFFSIVQIFEVIPAILADIFLWLMGKKRRYCKMQNKASTTRDNLYYFLYNSWIFSTERSSSLTQSLSEADKREFPFEPTSYTWAEYMPRHCRGIQDLLMKNIK